MLKHLFTVPKRKPFESLRSVYLRLADSNGFDSMRPVLSRLGTKGDTDPFCLLAGTGSAFERLEAEAPTAIATWRRHAALDNWLDERDRSYFRSAFRQVCPLCAADGWFDVTFDLWMVTACHRHRVTLLRHCPDCGSEFSWLHGSHRRCRCGTELSSLTAEPATDTSGIEFFFNALTQPNFQLAQQLLRLAYRINEFSRYCPHNDLFNAARALWEQPDQNLSHWLTTQSDKAPCLPHRVLLAPWLWFPEPRLQQVAHRLLRRAPRQLPICDGRCSDFRPLTTQGVCNVLAVSKSHLSKLVAAGFLSWDETPRHVTTASICGLFQLLARARSTELTGPYHYALSSERDRPLSTTLAQVKNGVLAVRRFSPRLSLSHLHLVDERAPPAPAPAGSDLVAIAVAAEFLKVTVRMLVRMLALPDISAGITIRMRKRYVTEPVIRALNARYVSLLSLRDLLKQPQKVVLQRLQRAGIAPIHDPLLDGSLLTVFDRPAIEHFLRSQGRRVQAAGDQQLAPRLTDETLDYHLVTQRLKRPGSALPGLVKAGLLHLSGSPVSSNLTITTRTQFSARSVAACLAWLTNSLPVGRAAAQFGLSEALLRKRLIYSGLLEPVCLGRSDHLATDLFTPRASMISTWHRAGGQPLAPQRHPDVKRRTRPTVYKFAPPPPRQAKSKPAAATTVS